MMLKILIILFFPSVVPYYFYNPSTNHIVKVSSLNQVPSGYKLLPPPKSNRILKKGNRYGYCIDPGFTCTTPYNISLTFQYECDNDYQCPATYKCCQHKCFVHKICSKATFTGIDNGNRPGNCEKWPYNCQKPYDYSLTSVFQCNSDRQCPRYFKCCQQNCFLHKICSRVTTTAIRGVVAAETYGESVNLWGKQPATERAVILAPVGEVESVRIYDQINNLVTAETAENIEATTEKEDEYDNETETEEDEYEEEIEEPTTEPTIELTTESTTEPTTEFTSEFTTEPKVEEPDLETEEPEYSSLSENPHKINLPLIVDGKTKQNTSISTSKKGMHDSNAIIPEYEEYYYDYGNGTDYDAEEDDNEEDE